MIFGEVYDDAHWVRMTKWCIREEKKSLSIQKSNQWCSQLTIYNSNFSDGINSELGTSKNSTNPFAKASSKSVLGKIHERDE